MLTTIVVAKNLLALGNFTLFSLLSVRSSTLRSMHCSKGLLGVYAKSLNGPSTLVILLFFTLKIYKQRRDSREKRIWRLSEVKWFWSKSKISKLGKLQWGKTPETKKSHVSFLRVFEKSKRSKCSMFRVSKLREHLLASKVRSGHLDRASANC